MKQILLVLAVFIFPLSAAWDADAQEARVPVIYCTDLFHPHDDPDDHFDLACLYAIPELDIKAIILDQGIKQQEKPGRVVVEQMNRLTGRDVPCAIGLSQKLESPGDTGKSQPKEYQAGVKTILTALRKSRVPVTIITVGSLRDVAAAYNREPKLFRKKVGRLFVFIGDAQAKFVEYNVELDVNAYRCVMNAPLPVHWAPCFDGGLWANEGNASFWQAKHSALLAKASSPVLNFFIYMMLQKSAEDPVAALFENTVPEEKDRVLAEVRNLWCCAVFPYIAGRLYVRHNTKYFAIPMAACQPGDEIVKPFTYLPVKMHVSGNGLETYDKPESHEILRFHVNDENSYATIMTSVTKCLIGELSRMSSPAR